MKGQPWGFKEKIRPNGVSHSGAQIGIRTEVRGGEGGGGVWWVSEVPMLPCYGLYRPSAALGPTSPVLFKGQILPTSFSFLLPPRPHNCLVFLESRCFFKGTQWFCSHPGDSFYPRVLLSNYATVRRCPLPLTQLAVFCLHVRVHKWNGMWDVYSRSIVLCLNKTQYRQFGPFFPQYNKLLSMSKHLNIVSGPNERVTAWIEKHDLHDKDYVPTFWFSLFGAGLCLM